MKNKALYNTARIIPPSSFPGKKGLITLLAGLAQMRNPPRRLKLVFAGFALMRSRY
jgi:hypothetical protein